MAIGAGVILGPQRQAVMIVRVFSPPIAVKWSAREHDPAENEVRLAVPARWKWNGSERVFHPRIFLKGLVKREQRSDEYRRAGQRNRKFPKRYAKHPAFEDTARRRIVIPAGSLFSRSGFLAAQLFGQNDRLGQLLHRTAEAAAFVAHPEISFFLGEILAALQD